VAARSRQAAALLRKLRKATGILGSDLNTSLGPQSPRRWCCSAFPTRRAIRPSRPFTIGWCWITCLRFTGSMDR